MSREKSVTKPWILGELLPNDVFASKQHWTRLLRHCILQRRGDKAKDEHMPRVVRWYLGPWLK